MADSLSSAALCPVGKDALQQLRQQADRTILIKFVAPHCSGCSTLSPMLQQLVADQADKLQLVSIDIVDDPEVAIEFAIRSVPTVAVVRGTEVLEQLVGLKPQKVYVDLIHSLVR